MKKQSVYNWNMVFFLTIIPLIGIFGTSIYIYHYGVVWQEPIFLLVLWFSSGMGITMGYHRLFAHKSFKTNNFMEWVLMILGSMAFENTILKWASDHRTHHSQAETEHDPYSITEGFWHAHMGWIIKNTPEEKSRIKGVKDLQQKSAIKFQNKYYFHIGILLGFILPLAIGFSYGRPLGALLWAGFLRVTIVHHATFFINSLCHYVGKRPYDFHSTARDSWIVSFFTFGEGYHNFHHKFQWDYRNGIKWFAFDPSKWIIRLLSYFGFTYDLKRVSDYLIWKSNLISLKDQLNDKYNRSSKECRVFYDKKIKKIYQQIDVILLSWSEMEDAYLKDKEKNILKNIENARSDYKKKLNIIRNDLSRVLMSLKRNSLSPELT